MKIANIHRAAVALVVMFAGLFGAIALPMNASADTDVTVQLTIGGVVSTMRIDSVQPSRVSVRGGETITITGENFADITGVTIDGKACAPFTVVNDTTISCVTPPDVAGVYGIIVSSINGDVSKVDAITYVEDGPIAPLPNLPLPPLAGLFAFFGYDGALLGGYDVIIALAVLLVLGGVIFFICTGKTKKSASKRKSTTKKRR